MDMNTHIGYWYIDICLCTTLSQRQMIVDACVCLWHVKCGCNVMTPLVVELITTVDLLTSNVVFVHLYLPMSALEMTIECWDIIHSFTKYDFYDINSDAWSLQFQVSNARMLSAAWKWTCFGNCFVSLALQSLASLQSILVQCIKQNKWELQLRALHATDSS